MNPDEQHYSSKQIAEKWALSEATVFRIFRDEPDVLRHGETSAKRRVKISLRIPEHVRDRVYARMTGQREAA